MPISFDERVDLAEEHLLGVFMNPRTASTVLSASKDELEALSEQAKRGELTLEHLGLDREHVVAGVKRLTNVTGDPEVDAVRVAYTTLAVNRDAVKEAVREAAPASGMRF